jgi:hypothetical protein
MPDHHEAFDEGAAAGRDLDKLAADCPYLPGDDEGRRSAWLEGFSSVRPDVSAASDPAHAAGAKQPEDDGGDKPGLHEG